METPMYLISVYFRLFPRTIRSKRAGNFPSTPQAVPWDYNKQKVASISKYTLNPKP